MTGYHEWTNDPSHCWVDDLIEADPRILDEMDAWWGSTSPVPMVGSRHHTVPRRYLQRFSAGGQIHVRDRVSGRSSTRNVKDAGAIKDFYTFINIDGQPDGRLERILGDIEAGGTAVFDRLLDPFRPARPLTVKESLHLSIYLGFQLLRTPRHRREVELMGDYMARTMHAYIPGIADVRVVPDPNLHLDYLRKNAPKIAEAFFRRPAMLLTIDQPLFITCDEPIVLRTPGDVSHIKHLPNCGKSGKRRNKNARRPSRKRMRKADTLHVYPTRPGAGQAAEVAMPLTPRSLLVLGPQGAAQVPPCRLVVGEQAAAIANDVNERLIAHSYQWVAAHPSHPTFGEMEFPAPGPIVQVCDGGSPFASELDGPPSPRLPELRHRRGR